MKCQQGRQWHNLFPIVLLAIWSTALTLVSNLALLFVLLLNRFNTFDISDDFGTTSPPLIPDEVLNGSNPTVKILPLVSSRLEQLIPIQRVGYTNFCSHTGTLHWLGTKPLRQWQSFAQVNSGVRVDKCFTSHDQKRSGLKWHAGIVIIVVAVIAVLQTQDSDMHPRLSVSGFVSSSWVLYNAFETGFSWLLIAGLGMKGFQEPKEWPSFNEIVYPPRQPGEPLRPAVSLLSSSLLRCRKCSFWNVFLGRVRL